MPILLRYTDLTPEQRQQPWTEIRLRSRRDHQAAKTHNTPEQLDPEAPFDWRYAIWMINNRQRPCENRDVIYLDAETPLELLLTTRPPAGLGERGRAEGYKLILAGTDALQRDVLDCKTPLLVLADWLYEHAMPEAELLRRFVGLPQRWDKNCFLPYRSQHITPWIMEL